MIMRNHSLLILLSMVSSLTEAWARLLCERLQLRLSNHPIRTTFQSLAWPMYLHVAMAWEPETLTKHIRHLVRTLQKRTPTSLERVVGGRLERLKQPTHMAGAMPRIPPFNASGVFLLCDILTKMQRRSRRYQWLTAAVRSYFSTETLLFHFPHLLSR